ncbi:MAG: dicarboxylate/amino acid:cation symporter [Victivallales bacterium]|nr:dicarboxylate/amino acid:cation symporter [Victivallales bacterium]
MNTETTASRNFYTRIPLVWRILIAFVLGIGIGIILNECAAAGKISSVTLDKIMNVVQPFGGVLVAMLKTVVFPIIFCSLVVGTASLPLKKFGRIGISVVGWYLFTSLCATVYGIFVAKIFNPSMDASAIDKLASGQGSAASAMQASAAAGDGSFAAFVTSIFQNPFAALANGEFLSVVCFAIIFGLAAKTVLDNQPDDSPTAKHVVNMLDLLDAVQRISFKLIDWVMEYFPIGVLSLTIYNFSEYGVKLFVPYSRIAVCVIICVLSMMFVVYPLMLLLFCRQNPYPVIFKMREAMLTAFLSRSSAATLPISMRTAEEKLGISRSLTSFSLPLGGTINMDGVCVHLPVFVILAANLLGIELTVGKLVVLVISVTLASVGVGGIPGGSIFLLFAVLGHMGINPETSALIVALALGINPLLDMFETCCNVTGDMVCTYIIGSKNGLVNPKQ